MGLYTHPPQTSGWSKGTDIAQRPTLSYGVATLHLMTPMDFWRNSTPFFGAAALCTTKIEDFRGSLTLTSKTTLSIVELFIEEEVIEVDKLKEKNNEGH